MDLSATDRESIDRIARQLKSCSNILFITGAGISAESGLPTYRGIGGLYNSKSTDEGVDIETALGGQTLRNRPELTWKYIAQIEQACRGATFNRAHEVIAEMERHFDRVWTLTQNIDGFGQAAGAKNVIDIHGDIHALQCMRCSYSTYVSDYEGLTIPPRCPECHAIVRPAVVLFGEMLPYEKVKLLSEQLDRGFDIVFSVGTTSVFPYIAQPVLDAKRRGVTTVEINPGQTAVTAYVDFKLALPAGTALSAIWQACLA